MISFGLLFILIPLTLLTTFLIGLSSATGRVPTPPSRFWIAMTTGIWAFKSFAWCLAAPAAILAVFIILGGGQCESGFLHFDRKATSVSVVVVEDAALNSAGLAPTRLPAPEPSRPAWILDQDKTVGDVQRVILSSQLWSTEAEAAVELQSKAAALLRNDFAQRHPGPFNSAGSFFMSDEQLANIAVKQRYVENIDQDFGKFSSPMKRLWWQVEISPLVRTEIYPSWKASVVRQRVFALGTTLAVIAFAANVVGVAAGFTWLRHPAASQAS